MTKPIDFGEVLRHIAAARNLPDPHPAAVDELARALARIRPDAIRAAVREWLDADTSGRLPLPGHLLPIAQRHARLLTLAERNDPNTLNELTVCAWCDGTRFIEVDEGSVVPCQRCIPSTYSRWKRGHFHYEGKRPLADLWLTMAQQAGDWVVGAGWFHLSPQDSSKPLTFTAPVPAVVPGSGFMASPYIRISYASAYGDLERACTAIIRACAALQ